MALRNHEKNLYRHLTLDGGASFPTDADAAVDGTTPKRFWIKPPTNRRFNIERLLPYLEDTGPLSAGDYGNISGPLGVGIIVRISDDSETLLDLTEIPILTNADWAHYCHDDVPLDFGSGANFLTVRWTFNKSGLPIVLDGDLNEKLEIIIQDNLSALVLHYFVAEGSIEEIPWI